MKVILAFLLLYFTSVRCLPPCPYENAAGDHHFVPSGFSKTIHIHQPARSALSWSDAQTFCHRTYNNLAYSGGKLWEPTNLIEYNAVRAEMLSIFPKTGQACKWWIGVKSPVATLPKPAKYASSGVLIPWHSTGYDHGWGVSICVAMEAGWPFMSGDGWQSWDCNTDFNKGQWICESGLKVRCPTTDNCRNAFPGTSLNGFCSDKSWEGGDCIGNVVGGKLICDQSCTCCKECLDLKCSDKRPGWECVNYMTAAEYPQGSCVYDGSCKRPDTSQSPWISHGNASKHDASKHDASKHDVSKHDASKHENQIEMELVKPKCACCLKTRTSTSTTTTTTSTSTTTTTTTTITTTRTTTTTTTTKAPPKDCDDTGCLKEFNGLGSCINVRNADWYKLDTIYNLSTPSRPDLCKHPNNLQCCTCLKKRECIDLGCRKQWNGKGICLNVTSKVFAEKSHLIDFTVGGRDDLCRSAIEDKDCCTCFKIKSKKKEANCCTKKTVGGVEYVLAEVHEDMEDIAALGCKDGCVYVADSGDKFCFKPGKLPSSCE